MPGSERPSAVARPETASDELAFVRRLSALIAADASPARIYAGVAREVAELLHSPTVQLWRSEQDGSATVVGAWSDRSTSFEVGSIRRWNDEAVSPIARAPIHVDGVAWGLLGVGAAGDARVSEGVERRLADVATLIAPTVAAAAMRERLARLADEQAAGRRVAHLVAEGAQPDAVFTAVAEQLAALVGAASAGLVRFEPDETATVIAAWGKPGETGSAGSRRPLGGDDVVSRVARTGRPARIDDLSVAGPVRVAGDLWGAMVATAVEGVALAPDAATRLDEFTELVQAAIANSEGRVELAQLVEEQAALGRVAAKVAADIPAPELFATVASEVAGVFGHSIDSAILRFEHDETATVVAVHGQQPAGGIRVGARMPIDGTGVSARVFRERRSVRVDEYAATEGAIANHAQTHGIRAAVGSPIMVRGRLWGAMVIAQYGDRPFPADAQRRVASFTEMIATAIANAQARAEVQRLADEQAALRRVATLAAEGASPSTLFEAVTDEVGELMAVSRVGLMRAERPDEVVVLAHRGSANEFVGAGIRLPLDGDSVTARVVRSGRSARLDAYAGLPGTIAEIGRRSGVNVAVAAPIVVEGAMWGTITASWEGQDEPPGDAEERLTEFAQLLDTAIANADSRDQLTASRARVLSAGDEARRRVVRDLHDGAQQRLLHTIVTLKLAQRAFDDDVARAKSLVAEALEHAEQGNGELRELVRGILPSVLTRGGLRSGVEALVSHLDVPVSSDITSTRLVPEIEASAYFIVAEALTNVVKHSKATSAQVTAVVEDGTLTVQVRDDGAGGADPGGHGLLGLSDRAQALGGRLRVHSPPGQGTTLVAELPAVGPGA